MKTLRGNRVRVEEIITETEKTESGIILPESVKQEARDKRQFLEGKTIQVGTDVTDIKEGDIIYYYKLAGLQYDNHKIITEKDVIGIK